MSIYLHKCSASVSVLVLASGLGLLNAGPASVFTIASFSGSTGTGISAAKPYAGVTVGADGFLYGTTHQGGAFGIPQGYGTVYKVSPAGAYTTLHSFSSTDGNQPYAGLTFGGDGNLYGTTLLGGNSGLGTVFRITPSGSFTSLLSFAGGNGAKPSGRLSLAMDGAFYGTTQLGGTNNLGTIFRVTTNGLLTSLFSFGGTNGSRPYAEVCFGPEGHLYGTTLTGGDSNLGTIFRCTTNGGFESLFSFSRTNGATPYAGLISDLSGGLYGATAYGGDYEAGTIFKIATNGVFTLVRSLDAAKDGANPWSTMLRGADGIYYGTTILGGPAISVPRGTVFQFMTNGSFAVLASFGFDLNGASPYGSLAQNAGGILYGTTFDQGAGLKGTVFRLDPAPAELRGQVVDGAFQISWHAWLGKTYQVQMKTNAAQPDWMDFSSASIATNAVMTVGDFLSSGHSFYRLKQFLP